jgi:hypothetical protein
LSFVIDALDECTSEPEVKDLIISLARALREPDLPVTHILLTSRSESYISKVFQDDEVRPLVREIPVRTSGEGGIISLDGADVDNDICTFLRHSFRELGFRHPDFPQPSEVDLAKLASRAGRRFIVASTVMKFIIDDEDKDPRDRLQLMLKLTSELLAGTEVYKLYDCILSTCADPKRAYMHLSIVTALADPLPVSQISTLLGPGLGRDVQTTLIQLRSFMDIPTDSALPVNIYHSSIRDYVSDPSNCSLPQVRDIASPHSILACSSLRLIKAIPKSRGLLDALSELKKQSKAMQLEDPHRLKDSLAFLVRPPEPLSSVICMLWLQGDRTPGLESWLGTVDGHAWLQTGGGREWLQTQGGREWLQTLTGREWLQTQGGREWLQTQEGREWLQIKGGREWLQIQGGRDWLQIQGGRDWLQIQGGREWLQTPGGRDWLQIQGGRNWLQTRGGQDWLQIRRGRDWLQTRRGRDWLQTQRGRDWLQTRRGRDWLQTQGGWLQTQRGRDLLQTRMEQYLPWMCAILEVLQTRGGRDSPQTQDGREPLQTQKGRDFLQTWAGRVWLWTCAGLEWLQTEGGQLWLQTSGGRLWLRTEDGRLWLQIRAGRDWLQTQGGQDWLQTQGGQDWLRAQGGRDWLQTQGGQDWLQTPCGRDCLQTPCGRDWLQTSYGRDWLQTPHGQAWQSTPAASVWVTMEEFVRTSEAVNEYIVISHSDVPLLSAFQVIQQFKTLPDFLMFPAFLALRHQHHSTSAIPESLLPDREIIHAINSFESFAKKALERSRSASDALKYACHNWAVHLSHALDPWDDTLKHIFQAFWNDHIIHWLEMEWCLKGLRSCLDILSQGQKVYYSQSTYLTS